MAEVKISDKVLLRELGQNTMKMLGIVEEVSALSSKILGIVSDNNHLIMQLTSNALERQTQKKG